MTNKRAPSQARALHGYVPPGPCPCAFLPTPDRRADAVVAAGLGHGCAGRGLLEHGDFRRWPSYGAGVRDSGARGNVGSFVVPSPADARSEEHTSELQSLMRISYAVFCLKKKKDVI